MQDPRWNRGPLGQKASGFATPPERSGSPVPQNGSPLPAEHSRDSSPAGDRGTYSIVFSAAWVHITTPIGEGAFSRVYEGVYTNPETTEQSIVAVKVLKKNMLKRRSDCLRFIKEAKIMTRITHSHIAACYGIGKYDDDDEQNPGSLFIVQELIKGGNLLMKVYKAMLNRAKCVYTSEQALTWMINVAEGMQYLHSITDTKPMIIHRDLKLENIMLAPWGSGMMAKLVDFGLHKVIDDRIKRVVKRVASEAILGNRLGLRNALPQEGMEEEEDELEAALRQQRAAAGAEEATSEEAGAGPGSAASSTPASPSSGKRSETASSDRRSRLQRGTSRLSLLAPAMAAHPEEDEEESAVDEASAAPSSQEALGNICENAPAEPWKDGSGSTGSADPRVRVRAPPTKQNSMQRLMAKMKEIKLRVTGKPGDISPNSNLSGASLTRSSSTLPPAEADDPMKDKMARNEALLNRIIAEQSTAQQEQQAVLDDLGIAEGATGQRARKAPPRRAVTWVNEVRYNLTEAVGSWAYMAPEVVLGQPYNEKVDVFSFGVILFEVLNRKLMLVDEIKTDPRKDAQAYAERVARGFRPEVPRMWPSGVVELISSCWAQDPHLRPNFTAIVDVLRELQCSGSIGKLDVVYRSSGSVFI